MFLASVFNSFSPYLYVERPTMRPLRLSEINLLKDTPDPMPDSRSLFLFKRGNM